MHDTTQKDTSGKVTLEITSELQAWRTRTLNVILTIAAIAAALPIVLVINDAIRQPLQRPAVLIFAVIYLFVVALAIFRRLDPRLRAWGLLLLGYAAGVLAFARGGLAGDGPMYLLALPVLAAILVSVRSGLVMAVLGLLTFAAFAVTAHLGWLANWLIIPDNPLILSRWVSKGTTFVMLLIALVVLQWLFGRFQTRTLQTTMERGIQMDEARALLQVRTEELDRRARQLEAIVHLSHSMTDLIESEEMLQRTATAIKEQFSFDGVAIYLTNESGDEVNLRASVGNVPEGDVHSEYLELMTQAIRSGTLRAIHPSAEKAPAAGPGRLVLPLRARGQTIGALAVQTREQAVFSDEDIAILQMMADQIAVAIDNARLFSEAQSSLRELHALSRQYAVEAWERYTQARAEAMRYSYGETTCSAQTWQAAREQARASGDPVTFTGDNENGETVQSLAAPVNLRGLTIGVLGLHRPTAAGAWRPEEITMVRMIADRLALAADNLRLLDETQRSAARERLVGEISDQMQRATDTEALMRITAEELNRVLGGSRTYVRLGTQAELAGGSGHEPQEERS